MKAGPRGRLFRLLNLRPGEPAKLLFLWCLYLLFTAATQIGDGVAQTLFLKRVGVQLLPVMFAVKAALDIVVAMLYVPLAARLGHPATLTLALALTGAGLLALWLPAGQGASLSYPAIYAWNEATATLLKIHWGVLLLDCFPIDDARRTFPLIYTGARAGAVLGGVALTALALPLGPENLLAVAAAVFLVAAALSLRVRRLSGAEGAPVNRESAAGRIGNIRRGLSVGLRVPLLRAIAVSTLLMVVCRYALRYRYSAAFAASFGEAELAAFYGGYMVLANGASVALQLVVTSRLLVHSGITQTNLGYAAAVLVAFSALGLWPGLVTAVVARLVDNELKAAVKTPLSNLFYGVLEPRERAAGRAFILGLVVPLATAGASLLLFQRTALRHLPLWGGALALLYVGATRAQNQAYLRAESRDPAD